MNASAAHRHDPADAWFVAVVASAGGLKAITTLLCGMPAGLPAAVAIVQHRPPSTGTQLECLLAQGAMLPVTTASHGCFVECGTVYLAASDRQLVVTPDRRFWYNEGSRVHGLRSAANPLFESVSRLYRDRTVAIVLTGTGSDGAEGVRKVKKRSGTVIVQADAEYPGMPSAAIATGAVDYVLPLAAIAPSVLAIVNRSGVERV